MAKVIGYNSEDEMDVDEPSSEMNSPKKRLEYILNQAEIYAHFMSKENKALPKGTKSKSSKADKSLGQPHRSIENRRNGDAEIGHDAQTTRKFIRFEQSPSFIKGTMRDYQLRGLNWMISLYENNINGILADEMGLGKTLQTISMIGYLMHFEQNKGPHLVIGPKSTLQNWFNEFNRFCPSVKAVMLKGDREARAVTFADMQQNYWNVCLTTYEMCLLAASQLKRYDWQYIVVDEAHRLKNENSKLSMVLRKFQSKNRLLLTGTPLQNNLHELWALLNYLLPDVFSSSEDFDHWFDSDDCLRGNDTIVKRLHTILRPFMLRRIKADVEKSLLPKKEVKLFVGLTPLQREVYKKVLTKEITVVNPFGEASLKSINFILMELRKVANHPYLIENVEPEPFTTDEHLINSCGKMMVLDKLLAKLKAQGSRVLLFSQFVIMLNILEDYMTFRGYNYRRLDGDTNYEDRAKDIDEFNAENSQIFAYMLSTRAGGLGINLATADAVIIYDSDWNPQPDLQAIDRAHRIGQKKQVRVFRLVAENTVDERIVQRAEIKLRLDKMVIQSGRNVDENANPLTKESKRDLIRFGLDKLNDENDTIDVDIDEILKDGEAKTAKELAEYEKLGEDELRNLTLEEASATSLYQFEGIDFRGKNAGANKVSSEGIRERRERKIVNYAVIAPMMARREPKSRNLILLHDFQFYPKSLYDLCEDEHFLDMSIDADDKQLKLKLISRGFRDWNRRDLRAFCNAMATFGRNNLKSIAEAMPHKSFDRIAEYHKVFWKRGAKEIENFDRLIRPITSSEAKFNNKKTMLDALHWKMSLYRWPNVQFELSKKHAPHKLHIMYTPDHDRYLICAAYEIGLDTPDCYNRIMNRIRSLKSVDWFIKSRTEIELKQRCETILNSIVKEYLNEKGKNDDASSSIHGESSRSRTSEVSQIEHLQEVEKDADNTMSTE